MRTLLVALLIVATMEGMAAAKKKGRSKDDGSYPPVVDLKIDQARRELENNPRLKYKVVHFATTYGTFKLILGRGHYWSGPRPPRRIVQDTESILQTIITPDGNAIRGLENQYGIMGGVMTFFEDRGVVYYATECAIKRYDQRSDTFVNATVYNRDGHQTYGYGGDFAMVYEGLHVIWGGREVVGYGRFAPNKFKGFRWFDKTTGRWVFELAPQHIQEEARGLCVGVDFRDGLYWVHAKTSASTRESRITYNPTSGEYTSAIVRVAAR